ncbi:lethal giant larvae like, C-terminal-domain-containing protein [Morchella snyderi]|nr:lethal giant larvae like, C-terminal-domain-containing protein [Morchella snyderi]
MEFLRSKQAGIQRDFTGGLAASDLFVIDEVAKYGIRSTISALAYDPIQSLFAVGTNETTTSPGEIHVFGQKRVHVTFTLQRKSSVKFLKLCDSKIVVVDNRSELSVYDMRDPGAEGVKYSPPGAVTSILADPSLDWVFLGLENGDIVTYDLDREILSPFRIPNLWRERSPKSKFLPVVSLALHPRDVGTLLIGYLEGTVIFSMKQEKVLHYFQFELPPGAPGADTERGTIYSLRRPNVVEALWHPTGTFVCTTHDDSCLAIWDPKDGRIVQSRTTTDSYVHLPGTPPSADMFGAGGDGDVVSIRQPLFKVAWCSTNNPDETSILIAGGNQSSMPVKGMTLWDLGVTPNMLTSSYQIISDYFASPKRQRCLPTPIDVDVVDFCLVPRTSPHYAGSHDPMAIIALLSSGELTTLRFPDGQPLSPATILHPSLSLCHPFATYANLSAINRQRWLGMVEKRDKPKEMIVGGIEHPKPLRRYENRTVVQTAHTDGTVKIWDLGLGDEIENGDMMEVDLGQVLQRGVDLKIESVSMAGATGEMAVGMETGEVVIYRWGTNKGFGRTREDESLQSESRTETGTIVEGIRNVQLRTDPSVREGLLPLCTLEQHCGSILKLKCSDVGFVAVAYQTGHISVLDLRGPAVIFHGSLNSLTKESKRASFRKSRDHSIDGEKATCLEFGVLTLEGDEFSSIALFVGSTHGRIATFKILPQGQGFTCTFAGMTYMDGSVVSVVPINSDSGKRAYASQQAVANLREGIKVPGTVVAVTKSEARIFKPPTAKGAHKGWDEYSCLGAVVAELDTHGICLSCVMDTGVVKSFSIPGLKEIGEVRLSDYYDPSRLAETILLDSGYIFGWTSQAECMLLYIWGKGQRLDHLPKDVLYNPEAPVPTRPTISNFQWISGTQHVTPADLDLLIGGPDRPMSKKMIEQMRAEEKQARLDARAGNQAGGSGRQEEGIFASMSRSIQERTEKLNLVGDSMDKLGETSASFADDVGKYVNQQKKKAILGSITGKWF